MYENITLHQYCLEVMITELKRYFEVSIIPDHNCQKKKNSSVRSEGVNLQKIKKEKVLELHFIQNREQCNPDLVYEN